MQWFAAALMLLSGITHNLALLQGDITQRNIGAGIFGGIYFLVGLGLLTGSKAAIVSGAIFPLIGLILGSYVFFFVQKDNLTPLHLVIDIIVIAYCARILLTPTSN